MDNPNSDEVVRNTRLGMLLIQQKQITETQLANALREHLITDKRLGDVLVEQNLVPRSVIDYYTLEQHRLRDLFDKKENFFRESSQLGYLLARTELVSPEEIEEALDEQRRSGGQLGDILVRRGKISRRALNDVLALQARFRRAALSASLSLIASLATIPHVNSANLTATGQIAITLRFEEQKRPIYLQSPDRFKQSEDVDMVLDADGKLHQLAVRLEDTELLLEVNSGGESSRALPEDQVRLDDYELEFEVESGGKGNTMSVSLSPT